MGFFGDVVGGGGEEPAHRGVARGFAGGPGIPQEPSGHNNGGRKPEYRPPFWQSKVQGKPYGDFGRLAARPSSARDPAMRPAAGGAAAGGSARVQSARSNRTGVVAVAPVARDVGGLPPGRLQQLEDRMRKCVQSKRALHKRVDEPLEKALYAVSLVADAMPKSKATEHMDPDAGRKVDVKGFIDAWDKLGLKVTSEEASAVFKKYGHDKKGHMPYKVFVAALMVGKSRLLGMDGAVRYHPFADVKEANFLGKIKYRPCAKAVYTPSDWSPALAARSLQVPEHSLGLEFVYGYEGKKTMSQNLYYTASGEVVYYIAGVAVVYDKEKHLQRHFLEHDDDIESLAISPKRDLVATGQVGKHPKVMLWRPDDLQRVQTLTHNNCRAVIALAFSPDASRLLACGADNQHTIHVWDWKKGSLLCCMPGQNGTPPQVYGLLCSPFLPTGHFLSWGVNHLKLWTPGMAGQGGQTYSGATLRFGKASTHVVTAAVVLEGGTIVTGMPEGGMAVWKNNQCVRTVPAHAKGPIVPRPDGGQTYGGLRCLRLRYDNKLLLSAGADGQVMAWDVTSGDIRDQSQVAGIVTIKSPYENTTPPFIRSLDLFKDSNVFIAGTHRCDIWEVDDTPEVLIYGHQADVWGLATNPVRPSEFATVSDASRIFLWDTKRRHMLRTAGLGPGNRGRSVGYSPDGKHLAVGMTNGGMSIMDGTTLAFVKWVKTFESAVADVKFSPDGEFLAAASHDLFIDVFSVSKGYTKLARCTGHGATVSHLDWSVDSKTIMSNCNAYEMLYWEPKTGHQVKANQRDTSWETYTCTLGFPVMGIWPSGSDGTDVNSLDRSRSQRYIATADDLGLVKLFNYPCVMKDPGCREYRGHSSHVMGVRFTSDDRRLITIGGKDCAVMQWRLISHPKAAPVTVEAPWGDGGMDAWQNPKVVAK